MSAFDSPSELPADRRITSFVRSAFDSLSELPADALGRER
jgi:hypothetical protein